MSIVKLINRASWSTYVVLTVIIAVVMLCLELYPFKFRVPVNGHGAVRKLLETMSH